MKLSAVIFAVLTSAALGMLVPAYSQLGTMKGHARVIDGDTIAIRGTKFRLNGVAAPERGEPGGRAATRWMRRHLSGRDVICKPNGERTYDRLVAICYVNGQDIGAAIIQAGRARDCPRYSGGRYRTEEGRARQRGTDLSRIYTLPDYCRQ